MLDRRRFVQSLAAAGGVQLAPGPFAEMRAQTPERSHPRISEVEFVRVRGKRQTLAGHNQQPQVKPLDLYPELRPAPYHESKEPQKGIETAERLYLRIKSDDGVDGLYG